MSDTFTANKGYQLPIVGGDPTTWGSTLNQDLGIIDSNLGGSVTINCAGSSNITLTAAQAQNFALILTGAITAAIEIIVPQAGGFYLIVNQTTGTYGVAIITSGAGAQGTYVPQGQIMMVWCNGNSVYPVIGNSGASVGDLKATTASTPPAGWYLCAGQAVSRTTYSALFDVIGTTWGSGDGSTTFNVPDLRGKTPFGADNMGGTHANILTSASMGTAAVLGVVGGNELMSSHDHTLTDPGHTHGHTDPGHLHGITDPGHIHQGFGNNPFFIYAGAGQLPGGTGSTPFESESATASATTSVTVNTATTGITNNTATTGITIASYGGGSSQNVPPAVVVNWIIYAGV